MDKLIADLEKGIKSQAPYLATIRKPRMLVKALKDLNNMIGNDKIKDRVALQVTHLIAQRLKPACDQKPIMLHSIIYGNPGVGKCLAKNTPVIMYNGSIKMVQDVLPGDLLMGDDSTPRKVLSTTKGTEKMYKIIQKYGDNYSVNSSHILSLMLTINPKIIDDINNKEYIVEWMTKEGERTAIFSYKSKFNKNDILTSINRFALSLPRIGSTIDIEIGEYIKRSNNWKRAYKGYKVSIEYNETGLLIDPYLMGLWLNDKENDEELPDEIYNRYSLFYRHIPSNFLVNSRENRLRLLSGLIDADSLIYNDRIEILIDTDEQDLDNDIVNIFKTAGLTLRSSPLACDVLILCRSM
jgi:hypothetical protein